MSKILTRVMDIHIEADTIAFDVNTPRQLADVLRRLVNQLDSIATMNDAMAFELRDNNNEVIGFAHYDDFKKAMEAIEDGTNRNSSGDASTPVSSGGLSEFDNVAKSPIKCPTGGVPEDRTDGVESLDDGRSDSHRDPGAGEVPTGLRDGGCPEGQQGVDWFPTSESEEGSSEPD